MITELWLIDVMVEVVKTVFINSSGVSGFKGQGGKEEPSEEKHSCSDPEEGIVQIFLLLPF